MSTVLRYLDCSSTGQSHGEYPPDADVRTRTGSSALREAEAWDAPTLISCSLYATAHLLAHRTFAVSFVRRKGLQLLVDIVTRATVVTANEVSVRFDEPRQFSPTIPHVPSCAVACRSVQSAFALCLHGIASAQGKAWTQELYAATPCANIHRSMRTLCACHGCPRVASCNGARVSISRGGVCHHHARCLQNAAIHRGTALLPGACRCFCRACHPPLSASTCPAPLGFLGGDLQRHVSLLHAGAVVPPGAGVV